MRFYDIAITKNGKPYMPSSISGLGNPTTITSMYNGQTNSAALNVEFDIPVAYMHLPDGEALMKIYGLSLKDIGVAYNLAGCDVTVRGGMAKGLPFANPAQQGILVKGTVKQAFGNWLGLDQTVEMIVGPQVGTNEEPLNLTLNWKAGTTLASALATAITTALPNAKQNIVLSDRLVQNHDQVGYYATVPQLADLLHPLSLDIIKDRGYSGVNIDYDGTTVSIRDFTGSASKPIDILMTDLVGQPTWIDFGVIQVKTVLRGDIQMGQIVTIPKGMQTTVAAASPSYGGTSFNGNFMVTKMHHYGNYRQADAMSWNTTFDLMPVDLA